MSENPIAKALNEEIGIDLSVKMDDIVSIVSSRKETEYKATINKLQKQVNVIANEIREGEKNLLRDARTYSMKKYKSMIKDFNFAAERLDLSAVTELGDCKVFEDDENQTILKTYFALNVRGGYSRVNTDGGEKTEVLDASHNLYLSYWNIDQLKDERRELAEELHENQRALNDLASMERQAKAKIAEATLSNTEAGQEFLNQLGDLDTSYMLTSNSESEENNG
jgi:hypothetical protein